MCFPLVVVLVANFMFFLTNAAAAYSILDDSRALAVSYSGYCWGGGGWVRGQRKLFT